MLFAHPLHTYISPHSKACRGGAVCSCLAPSFARLAARRGLRCANAAVSPGGMQQLNGDSCWLVGSATQPYSDRSARTATYLLLSKPHHEINTEQISV